MEKYYGSVLPDREGSITGPQGNGIWYRVNGVNRPGTPLLIVHGGPGFSHHYLLSLVDLAGDRPVYFYDQSGCGHSDRSNVPESWSIEYFVNEIGHVRRALGLTEYFLMGHSWGGLIVPPFAASNPDGIQGLILSSPAVSEPRYAADAQILRQGLPPEIFDVLERHERDGTREDREYQAASDYYYAQHFCRMTDWPQDISETFDRINEDLFHSVWGRADFSADPGTPARGFDGEKFLKSVTVPTLVTAGEFDTCTPDSAGHYASLPPNGVVEIFRGASHCPHYELRETFMETVGSWVASIENRSTGQGL